jgi:translation initiation factor IF-1
MVFDLALADAEIGGDVLARVSGKHRSKIWR